MLKWYKHDQSLKTFNKSSKDVDTKNPTNMGIIWSLRSTAGTHFNFICTLVQKEGWAGGIPLKFQNLGGDGTQYLEECDVEAA